jgi:ferredoxin
VAKASRIVQACLVDDAVLSSAPFEDFQSSNGFRSVRGLRFNGRRWFLTAGARGSGSTLATISAACLANAGVFCQACCDACPEHAIRFELGSGPPQPVVDEERCTACVPMCPAAAIALSERGG